MLGGQRIPNFPEVKTLKEQGYDYEVVSGPGIAGPAGMSAEAIDYVTKAFTKASKDQEFLDLLKKLDMLPFLLDKAQFEDYVHKSIPIKKKLVESLRLGYKQ